MPLCGTVLLAVPYSPSTYLGEHYENLTEFLRSSDLAPHVVSANHGWRYNDMGSRAAAAAAAGIRHCYRAR
jgi:hypothetical protein